MYEVRQPKHCEPQGSAQVTTGYFGDLADTPYLRLTTSSSVVSRFHNALAVVVVVGTVEWALRPGWGPAERRLPHTCPLVQTSGLKS